MTGTCPYDNDDHEVCDEKVDKDKDDHIDYNSLFATKPSPAESGEDID